MLVVVASDDFSQTRDFVRDGETELMYSTISGELPEQFIKEKAKASWLKVAKKVLQPTTMDVTRKGVRKTIRVDYQRGRVRAAVSVHLRP